MTQEYFSTFLPKEISDARTSRGMSIDLNCESREQVDSVIDSASKAGASPEVRKVIDLGWMYHRAFEDLDGHMFEIIWIDTKQAEEAMRK